MQQRLTLLVALAVSTAGLLLAGCASGPPRNDVRKIERESFKGLGADRALVLVGIASGGWVAFDKYNPVSGSAEGTCHRFDQIAVSVSGENQETTYALFDVPAGYYAFSDFWLMRTVAKPGSAYFFADTGKVNYIGDFTRTGADGDATAFLVEKNSNAANAVIHAFGVSDIAVTEPPLVPISPEYIFVCSM